LNTVNTSSGQRVTLADDPAVLLVLFSDAAAQIRAVATQ
jgi:hypothetical protein